MFTRGRKGRLCRLHRKAESGEDGGPGFGFSKAQATGDFFFFLIYRKDRKILMTERGQGHSPWH